MSFRSKIAPTLEDLLVKVQEWKAEGKRIVFTNGVFDLLHLGHVSYLASAKSKGDVLIVGVNSDASVKENKGDTRPINNELSRKSVVAALESVDAVVVFQEKTPLKLIEQILPDILVKGADYSIETIVGADVVLKNGGEVLTVELEKGYASTNIIEKIKNL